MSFVSVTQSPFKLFTQRCNRIKVRTLLYATHCVFLIVAVTHSLSSTHGGGGLETWEGESEIVITSWLLVPLLEVTTLERLLMWQL